MTNDNVFLLFKLPLGWETLEQRCMQRMKEYRMKFAQRMYRKSLCEQENVFFYIVNGYITKRIILLNWKTYLVIIKNNLVFAIIFLNISFSIIFKCTKHHIGYIIICAATLHHYTRKLTITAPPTEF